MKIERVEKKYCVIIEKKNGLFCAYRIGDMSIIASEKRLWELAAELKKWDAENKLMGNI